MTTVFENAMQEINSADAIGGVVNALGSIGAAQTATGGFGSGTVTTTAGTEYTWIWPTYCQWWPTYWPTAYEDKHAKAFRVVKALMDSKAVRLTSIKKFVDLVDEIAKVL